MSFTKYQFPLEDINGPMVDSNEQVVFIISTTWGLLKGGPTTVTRPDGTVMGDIQLQPLWFPSKVTIHGNEVKDFMDWGGDGVVVFSAKTYKFKDGDGKEFYWKDDACYAAESQEVVAKYGRQTKSLWKTNIAASLAVNDAYLPSIDYILLSALLVTLKHKSKERRGQISGGSGGA